VEIGDLVETEIEAAVALWRDCGLTRPWNDPHADVRLAMRTQNATILAGRLHGSLVATAMVGVDGHRGWIYYLAVDPGRRKQGLGAAMMRASEEWVRRMGAPKIQLMVRTDNIAANTFYEAIGYERQAVSVFGRRLDGG
jgi:ribosomal protein S18 acetylase RimI-like enzyme